MTWDFRQRAQAFLRPGVRVLFIGREGMEALLEQGHPFSLLSFALPPVLCPQNKRRLEPLGAAVKPWLPGEPLPFPDASMDLILQYQQPCDVQDIHRVLKPGGFFLTQQVGGSDAKASGLPADYNLENWQPLFRQAGFRIIYGDQSYEYEDPEKGQGLRHRFFLIAGKRAGK